jgi:hypothetical protein
MVNEEWIENKIIRLENDRNNELWTDIREDQLKFLFSIYKTGNYVNYSEQDINDKLILIYNFA